MSTHSLYLRTELNRRLTINEMDSNFIYLEELATSGVTGSGSFDQDLNTFDDVLFDSITTEYIIGTQGAIYLMPDTNVSWQSVIIYPTNNVIDENHIHIAPAAPWTDLFLGTDDSYVAVKSTGDVEIKPLSGTISVKGDLNLFNNEIGNINILKSNTSTWVQGIAADDSGYTYIVGGNNDTNIVSKIKDGEFIWSEEILITGLSPSTTLLFNSVVWSLNKLYVTAQWATSFTVLEIDDFNGDILNTWTYDDAAGFYLKDIELYENNPVVVGTKSNEYIVATVSSVSIGSTVSNLYTNTSIFNDIQKVPQNGETWEINGDGFTDWTQVNQQLINSVQNLPVMGLSGSGQDLTVDVYYTPGGEYLSIGRNTLGTGYNNGDFLLVKGSLLSGIDNITYSAEVFNNTGESVYIDASAYPDFDQVVQNGWLVSGTGITGSGTVSNLQNTGALWRVDIGQNVTLNSGDTIVFDNNGNDCKFRISYVDQSNMYFDTISGNNAITDVYIPVSQPVDFSQPGTWQLRISTYQQAFIWTKNWSKSIGNTGYENGKSVAIDSNNNIYFSMEYSNNQNSTGLVTKLNSDGDIIWSNYFYDSTNWSEIFSICIDSEDNLFLLAFNDDGHTVLTKVTTDGEIIWQRILNENNWDAEPQIETDINDNVIISGSYNIDTNDYAFIKIDTNGNVLNSITIGDAILQEYDNWNFNSKLLAIKGEFLYKAGFRYNSNNIPEGIILKINTDLDGIGEYSKWVYKNIDLVFNVVNTPIEPVTTPIYFTDIILSNMGLSYSTNISTGFTLEEILIPKNNNIKNVESIIFTDGSSIKSALVAQNLQKTYNDYTLQLSDIGKHIYRNEGDGYGVYIPTNDSVPFPIGSTITFVSGDSILYFHNEDDNVLEVWGAGFTQTSNSWYIPSRSIATLLKIETNTWMLSGTGLDID